MITDAYKNLSEFMDTEEIADAWRTAYSDFSYVVSTLREAISNRLSNLDFDEDEYEDGSNNEIEKLLEIRNELDSLDSIF